MTTQVAPATGGAYPPPLTTPFAIPPLPLPLPLYLAKGLLVVAKPLTWTSNDVVSYIRGLKFNESVVDNSNNLLVN